MPAKLLPSGVTTITPPAVSVLSKVCQVARTDTAAFDAFALPAGAVVLGAYVVGTTASDAATTATVRLGSVGTPTGVINDFSVKTNGAGYYAVGAQGGSLLSTQLTADTKLQARYAETGTASTVGGPWLLKVEYYLPQAGNTY